MGILAKARSNSQLQELRHLVSDKTGTPLTKGTPDLTGYWLEDEAMIPAVAAMEKQSTHPLAQAAVQNSANDST